MTNYREIVAGSQGKLGYENDIFDSKSLGCDSVDVESKFSACRRRIGRRKRVQITIPNSNQRSCLGNNFIQMTASLFVNILHQILIRTWPFIKRCLRVV